MKRPEQALVLAAGFGTRLHPLTLSRPKPLVPVWGKPILRHVLEGLRDWGVKDVVINLHHGADALLNHLRLDPVPGLRCAFSFEPRILGTGGALSRAGWFLARDRPFWIMNADVLGDLSPLPLMRAFEHHRAIAALWLDPERGPRTVETRGAKIACFRSRTPGAPGTATFCGLQLVSPRILRYLPETDFCTLVDVYEAALKNGERVLGVTVPGAYWSDIGTPDDYRAAHRDTRACARRRQPGSRFAAGCPRDSRSESAPWIASGSGSRMAPGARVVNSVLWEQVTVRSSARVENAIVGDGVTLAGHVPYMALRADRVDDPVIQRTIRALDWNPGRTLVLPLPPRGSARTFTRLRCGRRSVILVRYSLERPENGLYAGHAAFLRRHGLRVPRVWLNWPGDGLCVMEDVGERSLQDVVPCASPARCAALYRAVIPEIVRLHDRATRAARRARLPLCQPFTRHLYEWEQNLFCEQFLARHLKPAPPAERAIRDELRRLIPPLLRVPRTLVHRDLQSSNILLHHGEPVLIDFQGMRYGAPSYDLASLLCDPYVRLPLTLREALLAQYVALAPDGQPAADTFWLAAAERLVQALGAFGRLGASPATRYFLRHIPAAVAELRHALAGTPPMPALLDALDRYLSALRPTPPPPR